ncbi:MAG: hypothetical protein HY270_24430 [Deltaproteobacteria bacterium]|nr:hypothetical protein [Deltaproteobacteria bacterium]
MSRLSSRGWWVCGNSGRRIFERFRRLALPLMLSGVGLGVTALPVAAAVRLVSTAGADAGDCTSSSCATIQYAVSQANASGDTISVAAGTYTENVTTTKSLTLLGAQAGVDARGRVASETIVSPANATLATFTISVNGLIAVDGFSFVGGSAPTQGCVYTNTGPNNSMQIVNNRFSGYSTQAIWLARAGSDITIDRNVLDGSNIAAGSQAIFLSTNSYAGLYLTNNDIINNTNRYGLFVDGNHNVGESATRAPLISGNLFDNNNQGMNLGSRSFGTLATPLLGPYGGTISNNTFSNHAFGGIQGGVQHVLIDGNSFTNNGGDGLALTSFGNTGSDRGGQNSMITNNCFTRNGLVKGAEGILFSAAQAAGSISTNHAHNNNLRGNNIGVKYTGTETINAENNWWGCPTGANSGICDSASANVDSTPFLSTPAMGTPCGCTANAQCDDGLGCNGVETCSAGSCVAGVSVNCSGLDADCSVGTCSNPSGDCIPSPRPAGTLCRGSVGECDVADTCDGSSLTCPADSKSAALCRPVGLQFFQGFTVDDDQWNIDVPPDEGNATRVPSGTHGITSKVGTHHAEAVACDLDHCGGSAFTRWGGYNAVFPAGGYMTSIDIYLDLSIIAKHCSIHTSTACTVNANCPGSETCVGPNDTRFDFSSAINGAGPGTCLPTAGTACNSNTDCTVGGDICRSMPFLSDFAFNAGFYNDSDATGSGPRFVIAAGSNAGRGSSYPKDPGHDPFTITTSGWYTFQHVFHDDGSGLLAVDLIIKDSNGTSISPSFGAHSAWRRTSPGFVIGPPAVGTPTVGGNRYGWFASSEFPFLAFDDSQRTQGAVCDIAEFCDGVSNTCPADTKSTAVCRPSVGECDLADSCDGSNNDCPVDGKSTAVCRPAVPGGCDVADSCDGVNDICPPDTVQPAGTVCRSAVPGGCDIQETCTGTNTCPPDTVQPSGSLCRPAVPGGCDIAENCDGSNTCPADIVEPSGTVCRLAVPGGCDVVETCNGTNTCPPDTVEPTGTVCRPAVPGGCDIAETCNGSNSCPADTVQPSGTVCRNATGECDLQETCNGTNSCPADARKNAGTACTADSNQCTLDQCNGSAVTCQHPAGPDGVMCNIADVCRAGSCVAPTSLVLNRLALRTNTAQTGRPDNGYVIVRRALIDDNDTPPGAGKLQEALLANGVTLDVNDEDSTFNTRIALTGCKLAGHHGKIRCRNDATRTRATFSPIPGPLVYRAYVSQRRIGTSGTGLVAASGKVTVVLHQGVVDRTDDIPGARCKTRGVALVLCVDP